MDEPTRSAEDEGEVDEADVSWHIVIRILLNSFSYSKMKISSSVSEQAAVVSPRRVRDIEREGKKIKIRGKRVNRWKRQPAWCKVFWKMPQRRLVSFLFERKKSGIILDLLLAEGLKEVDILTELGFNCTFVATCAIMHRH